MDWNKVRAFREPLVQLRAGSMKKPANRQLSGKCDQGQRTTRNDRGQTAPETDKIDQK